MSRTATFLRPMEGALLTPPPSGFPHADAFAAWFDRLSAQPTFVVDELQDASLPVTTAACQPGRCANFDGAADYVHAPLSAAPTYPFTMMCWFNVDNLTASHFLLSLSDGAVSNQYIDLYVDTSGQLFTTRTNTTPVATDLSASTALVAASRWYHVAVVYVSATAVKMYINGYLRANLTGLTSVTIDSSFDDFCIAKKAVLVAGFADGKIFDARLYDTELTATQICNIYDSTRMSGRSPGNYFYPASSMLAHWRLDDGRIRTSDPIAHIRDSSGNGNHGRFVSAAAGTTDYTGVDVPCSFENELGYSPLSSLPATWTERYTTASWSTWTAGGTDGNATALSSQSWDGETGLYAAKFNNGALGGFANNNVSSNTLASVASSPEFHTTFLEIALSRPLVGSESFGIGYSGADFALFTASTQPENPMEFNVYPARLHYDTSSATRTAFVEPITNITGGDLTIYIKKASWCRTNQPGNTVAGGGWMGSYNAPVDSSDLTSDIRGELVRSPGPLAKPAKLKSSPCLTLDGVNDAGVATDLLSGSSALTVSFWFSTTTAAGRCMWSNWDNVNQRSLFIGLSGGKLFLVASGNGATTQKDYRSFQNINTGQWIHIAVTFATNDLRVYFDGVETLTDKITDSAITSLHNSTAPIAIGNYYNSGALTGDYFPGSLCDIRVYTSTLTAQNIADIYAGTYVGTPVAYWPCCESGGTTLYDVSGNGRHATLTGGTEATYWAQVQDKFHYTATKGFRQVTRGRAFNGTTQYLELLEEEDFRTGAIGSAHQTDYWVAAWVNASTLSATNTVCGLWQEAPAYRQWLVDWSSNTFRWTVSNNGTAVSQVTTSWTATGQWVLLFAYHDATSDTISIATNGSAFVTPVSHSTGIYSNDAWFHVGVRRTAAASFFYHWNGSIRMAAMGKPPSNPASWTAIRDAIYNNGDVLTYDDLSDTQKTDWGVVDWFDMDGQNNLEVGRHTPRTQLTGANMSEGRKPQVGALVSAPSNGYQTFVGDPARNFNYRSYSPELQIDDFDFAFTGWVRPANDHVGHIINQWESPYTVALRTNTSSRMEMRVIGTVSESAFENYTLGQTISFVGYYDATAGAVSIAVNNGSFVAPVAAGPPNVVSSAGMFIGTNGTLNIRPFDGDIVNVAFWKPPTNPSDWAVLRDLIYNGGTPLRYTDLSTANKSDWGLVSWWECDDTNGVLRDSHGTNHMIGLSIPSATSFSAVANFNQTTTDIDFTNATNAPWVQDGHLGYYSCSGSVVTGVNVQPAVSDQFNNIITLYARIRINSWSGGPYIFHAENAASADRLAIGIDTTGVFHITTDVQYDQFTWSGAYDDGEFHDVVVVINGTSVEVFVDGSSVSTDTITAFDWSGVGEPTNARIMGNATGSSANQWEDDIARLVIAPSVHTTASIPTAVDNVLDIKFDDFWIADEQCRILPVYYTVGDRFPQLATYPTAYKFGDGFTYTQANQVVRQNTHPLTEHEFQFISYDE